jgi:hypothetical protein
VIAVAKRPDDSPEKGLIGGLVKLVDPKLTAAASVAVAVYVAIAGVLAFATRDTLLPIVLDDLFHVSANLGHRLQGDVASGYSRTFIFDDYQAQTVGVQIPQSLLFHYTQSQEAELVLTGTAIKYSGRKPLRVKITVDDVLVATNSDLHRELPIKGTTSKLPQNLFDETIITENVHVLKILPEPHEGKALIVLDALVLVSNPPRPQ